MPSVDELAADDPYDVEAATRAAKKMTSAPGAGTVDRGGVPPTTGPSEAYVVGS